MNQLATSLIRTLTPRLAAWLIVLAAKVEIDIDTTLATVIVAEIVGAAYYLTVRLLEQFKGSKWGRLLGVARQPSYAPAAK